MRFRTIRAAAVAAAWLLLGAIDPGLRLESPLAGQSAAPVQPAALPARLSDAEFWTLVGQVSEPGGYFQITDNYTSNEREIGRMSTMIREANLHGGVFLGVGPEQNFSYIAAMRPAMAFIIDIRRQAVMQHLMFKAIFETSPERADFIATLFSKPRPAGLTAETPIQQIWEAFSAAATPAGYDRELAAKTHARIVARLTKTHGFSFTADELAQLETVFRAFQVYGPAITTRGMGGGFNAVTFADLTGWMLDDHGEPQSFLSTEDNYRYVRALHEKNLIVPVSGDFAGPKALRAIGAYLREHGGTVTGFYVSNVEQYLYREGKDRAFFDNVATLPITPTSVFIRPYSLRSGGQPLCPIGPFLQAVNAGRVFSNNQALACAR